MFIQINDGRKTYDIQNQDGEVITSVTFNPLNSNILKKCDSVAKQFDDILTSIKNMPATSAALDEKEKEAMDALNALFCADVSTPFFSILGVFSRVGDGKYFLMEVLEQLMSIVRKEHEDNTKKANKKMEEYLEGYTEGEPK